MSRRGTVLQLAWLAALLAGLLAGLLAACAAPTVTPSPPAPAADTPAPIYYASAPGGFSVQLPAALALQELAATQTLAGQLVPCTAIVAKDDGALWSIQYCDLPPETLSQAAPQALLDSAQEQALAAHAHKLTDQRDLAPSLPYPARQFTAAINMRNNNGPFDSLLQARLYLTPNRLYTVMAQVYTATAIANTRLTLIAPFLDSFTIEAN